MSKLKRSTKSHETTELNSNSCDSVECTACPSNVSPADEAICFLHEGIKTIRLTWTLRQCIRGTINVMKSKLAKKSVFEFGWLTTVGAACACMCMCCQFSERGECMP